MRRAILFASALTLLLLSGLAFSDQVNIANTDPRSPADEARGFHLPPGFEAQLVASEPDIHKPLNIDFDDRGRLWVSETVEYPYPEKDGKLKNQDAVKILEDFGPDGKARKITTFADKLDIPIGVLPLLTTKPQDALVYSIPSICRMRDADGDGKADERTVLYTPVRPQGHARHDQQLHLGLRRLGLRLPRLFQRVQGQGRRRQVHHHAVRQRLPPAARRLATSNTTSTARSTRSAWPSTRSATSTPATVRRSRSSNSCAAATTPASASRNDGLGFAPAMLDHYGDSTAIAGIAYYAADQFPEGHRDSGYVGDVVTNRVNEFRLTWHGTTPVAAKQDFLVSDDRWFRPVQVKLGPDGALVHRRFL